MQAIVTHILKLPRKKGRLSHNIQNLTQHYCNIRILMHAIITPIQKFVKQRHLSHGEDTLTQYSIQAL